MLDADDVDVKVEENAQDDGAEDAEALNEKTSQRPGTWILPGWVSYHLFGPHAHKTSNLYCLKLAIG